MKARHKHLAIMVCFGIASPSALASPNENYRKHCASCHGPDLAGGFGSSLVDDEWVYGGTAAQLKQSIRDGILAKGMPAWGKTFSNEELDALVQFILNKGI